MLISFLYMQMSNFKATFFSQCIVLTSLSMIRWLLFIDLHDCFVGILCIFIFMDLQYNLNTGMVTSPVFFFFFFICLDINSPWGFHLIFRIIAFYFCEKMLEYIEI